MTVAPAGTRQEGALESRIEHSRLDDSQDGDRMREAMAEVLGRIEALGSKPVASCVVHCQQKGLA